MRLSLSQGEIEYRRYQAEGTENAATIVLLHEGLGSVAMWKDFPNALSSHSGFNVLAYSRFGYGSSSPVPLPRPMNYMQIEGQEVLPEILEALVEGDYFLLGHSDGASIAAVYSGVHKVAAHRGTIVMAPHFFTEDMGLKSIAAVKRAYEETGLRERLARYHDDVDNAFYGWNGAWLDPEFKQWNIEKFLPEIDVPLLAIQGEGDEYGTSAQIETMTKNCKAPLSVSMLADCGHSPHRDQLAQTLRTISTFVTDAS